MRGWQTSTMHGTARPGSIRPACARVHWYTAVLVVPTIRLDIVATSRVLLRVLSVDLLVAE